MFYTPPPLSKKPSQPSRSSRLGWFQGEGDTSPGVAPAVLIADMVLCRQSPGPDVQPHSQGVGLHVGLESRRQLRGRTAPGGPVYRHKGGNGLLYRVGRFHPRLRFQPLQLPHKALLVLGEIHPLVLLVTSGHIQNGAAVRPLFLLKKKGPVRRS